MLKDVYPIKLFLTVKANIIMISFSIVINILTWLWLFLQIRPREDYIFLHYNILFGVDYIGDWWKIVYVPATGIIILFANIIAAWFLYKKDKFASYLILAACLYSQIFLFIAASLLVFLNV
ncbi:MAG: hypothetical protein GF349_02805 [Candidatus Magasanikbacteria bacterium]|nr:hypothetical protein [Candidatus Magasanikbacteria bacterium]